MSGHSKWHSIKHKKGAADIKRGAIFTKLARLITVAARAGGNQDMNPTLRLAIERAKAQNVPNTNIERAIKRGTGELKDAAVIEAITYEGYGPGGVALLVHCLTDNRQRTAPAIRHIFSKHGGSLGAAGCVAWMFKQCGVITVAGEGKDLAELSLSAIDAGATDVETGEQELVVYTGVADLAKVRSALLAQGIKVANSEFLWLPKETVSVTDEGTAKRLLALVEALEDEEDVSEVAANFDIPEESLKHLTEQAS